MHWGNASLKWVPEVSRQSVRLKVVGFFEQYAAVILQEDLLPALMEISKGSGLIDVEIEGGVRMETPNQASFEPGTISIVAERLTERFDAAELRQCVQAEVDRANFEGERQAKQDEERARAFLEELAAETPS